MQEHAGIGHIVDSLIPSRPGQPLSLNEATQTLLGLTRDLSEAAGVFLTIEGAPGQLREQARLTASPDGGSPRPDLALDRIALHQAPPLIALSPDNAVSYLGVSLRDEQGIPFGVLSCLDQPDHVFSRGVVQGIVALAAISGPALARLARPGAGAAVIAPGNPPADGREPEPEPRPDLVIELDRRGVVREVRQDRRALFGNPRADLVGRPWLSVVHEADQAAMDAIRTASTWRAASSAILRLRVRPGQWARVRVFGQVDMSSASTVLQFAVISTGQENSPVVAGADGAAPAVAHEPPGPIAIASLPADRPRRKADASAEAPLTDAPEPVPAPAPPSPAPRPAASAPIADRPETLSRVVSPAPAAHPETRESSSPPAAASTAVFAPEKAGPWQGVLDAEPAPVFLLDQSTRLLALNTAARQTLGLAAGAPVAGRLVSDFLTAEGAVHLTAILVQVAGTRRPAASPHDADATGIAPAWSVAPMLDPDQALTGFVCVCLDQRLLLPAAAIPDTAPLLPESRRTGDRAALNGVEPGGGEIAGDAEPVDGPAATAVGAENADETGPEPGAVDRSRFAGSDLLAAVLNATSDRIALYNHRGWLTRLNDAAFQAPAATFGVSARIAPRVLATGAPALPVVIAEAGERGAVRHWLLRHEPLLAGPGRLAGVLCRAVDITRAITARADADVALQRERQINAELIELTRAESAFIARVSHEFRTPLTAIQGYADLLRDFELTEATVHEYSTEISASAERLTRMINDVLELERLRENPATLNREVVDLGRLLTEVASMLRPIIANHQLLLDIAPGLPTVIGDSQRLFQVMTNIAGNALKYSPDGGEVWMRAWNEGPDVLIRVSDQGIGIPREDLQRIFQPYQRARGAGKVASGAGLGLAIARQIVEMHGGMIWAESEPGRGSAFTLRLPVGQESTERSAPGAAGTMSAAAAGA